MTRWCGAITSSTLRPCSFRGRHSSLLATVCICDVASISLPFAQSAVVRHAQQHTWQREGAYGSEIACTEYAGTLIVVVKLVPDCENESASY